MKEKEKTIKSGGAGFPAWAPKDELSISRRRLPHWRLPGSTYFVTFRLKSGLMSEDERMVVLESIKHFHKVRYWVTAAVVMPDHAHLILKPVVFKSEMEYPLNKILQGIKGLCAREINKSKGTKGSLWQDESYDRMIRDHEEYLEKWHYIRDNPVKDRLSETPEEYPFLWEPGEPAVE